MELYINGAGFVGTAGNNSGEWQYAPLQIAAFSTAKEPDYAAYIAPMQARRMSKAVRMGIVASKIALEKANSATVDALSIGTAIGCIQDTEVFLKKMVQQEEQMLTPTSFIQSTHNTVSGQIALLLGCHGHNLTFSQKGHSFEQALLNAQLYLQHNPAHQTLVGGVDEHTDSSYELMKQAGAYPAVTKNSSDVVGEGAAFFMISAQQQKESVLKLLAQSMFTLKTNTDFEAQVKAVLVNASIPSEKIGLVFSGKTSGDNAQRFYAAIDTLMPAAACFHYKNVSGDYPTATSMALALLQEIAQNNTWAAIQSKAPEYVLLANHFGRYYSLQLLEVLG